MKKYNDLFPQGLVGYSTRALWEIYDKVGVEIHNRGIEDGIENEIDKIIVNCQAFQEFVVKSKGSTVLKQLRKVDLADYWMEYWNSRYEEQEENKEDDERDIDDFRATEDDFVK